MTPFEAYKTFLGIKYHFTTAQYDYIKYHGKVRATIQAFEKRRDKFHFAKLAKHKDVEGFLVANYVSGGFTGWVGDLFTDESDKTYYDWLARQQSLTYKFKTDLEKLEDDFVSYFKVSSGQHPKLLVLYKRDEISIETLIILNRFLKFFPVWDQKISDTVIWPKIHNTCIKYEPFIHYDKEKVKGILKDIMNV